MTASSDRLSWLRTKAFSSAGNTSTNRSTACVALRVCKVANTKCPVSAALSAKRMVVKSRNSPTMMTSGSCRKAARNADGGGYGGGYSSGAGSYGGGGGGSYDRGPREMFTATCSSCGREAQVPFRPTSGKPVYCSDCFRSQRG